MAQHLDTFATIRNEGYAIYTRPSDGFFPHGVEYCYYTDGKRIGYAQFDPMTGYTVSTVHKPSQTHGTGYQIERHVDSLTSEVLTEALETLLPVWADHRFALPRKYTDWNDFQNANAWNKGFQKA